MRKFLGVINRDWKLFNVVKKEKRLNWDTMRNAKYQFLQLTIKGAIEGRR